MSLHRGQRRNSIDWKSVDWTKPDMALSFKYSVSRSHVIGMRKAFGKPFVKQAPAKSGTLDKKV